MDNIIINEDKETIKKEINTFCNELYNLEYTGYVSVPVIIIMYLGQDSYSKINASLQDAFISSFSMQPSLIQTVIDLNVKKEEIENSIKEAIKGVSLQGKNYSDIRIAFVSMMNDEFFKQSNREVVTNILKAFEDLQYLGLNLTKKAFYGLFDQNLMKENYQSAFSFINDGKKLWNNIYHIEIPFVDSNLTKQAQLIALNIIRDDYNMKQDENDGYRWASLYLHYLRISEFITCRLLREIYGKQVDNRQMDTGDWSKSVNEVLDLLFSNLLNVKNNSSYQYVPLNYQETVIPKKKRGFGIFSKKEQNLLSVYNKILKDENVVANLVEQLYENISIDEESYSKIIEKIISSATSIDPNSTVIANHIVKVINSRIERIEQQIYHLKEKKISDTTISNVNDYLQLEYNYQHQIIILEKEKMIIEQVKKNISDDIVLKRVINDIVKKNHNYANLLDELTLSEYGGTLEMLNIQNLPAFQVNLSVNEILHIIDKSFVNEIINNNQSLSKRLQLFLNHTIFNDIPYKHNIGIINKQYTNIQDIISYLLIPTSLSNNTDIFEVTKNYENLLRDVKDIYRVNSFFIISSRTYDSDQYIVNYKRGE